MAFQRHHGQIVSPTKSLPPPQQLTNVCSLTPLEHGKETLHVEEQISCRIFFCENGFIQLLLVHLQPKTRCRQLVMAEESTPIPVVSFEKFLTGDRADQKEVAKQVYDAFSTIGFIYLKDHGIPQSRVEEIFELVRPKSSALCSKRVSVIDTTRIEQDVFHPSPRGQAQIQTHRSPGKPRVHGRRRRGYSRPQRVL